MILLQKRERERKTDPFWLYKKSMQLHHTINNKIFFALSTTWIETVTKHSGFAAT